MNQSQLNKPDDDKPPMDPDDYVRNKRKLKKAVLEQYRYVFGSKLIFRMS